MITTPAQINIFVGNARVDCPGCGEEHVSQRYSYGRDVPDTSGGRAFCDECARQHVPEEEFDILAKLNELDTELWYALERQGVGEERMRRMLRIVARAAADMVANYERALGDAIARQP